MQPGSGSEERCRPLGSDEKRLAPQPRPHLGRLQPARRAPRLLSSRSLSLVAPPPRSACLPRTPLSWRLSRAARRPLLRPLRSPRGRGAAGRDPARARRAAGRDASRPRARGFPVPAPQQGARVSFAEALALLYDAEGVSVPRAQIDAAVARVPADLQAPLADLVASVARAHADTTRILSADDIHFLASDLVLTTRLASFGTTTATRDLPLCGRARRRARAGGPRGSCAGERGRAAAVARFDALPASRRRRRATRSCRCRSSKWAMRATTRTTRWTS